MPNEWKVSSKGNPHITIHGTHATVYPVGIGFRFVCSNETGKLFTSPVIATLDEAKTEVERLLADEFWFVKMMQAKPMSQKVLAAIEEMKKLPKK